MSLETYSRISHCPGRNNPQDVRRYARQDLNPTETQLANGTIQPCQRPPQNKQCPVGYTFIGQCKDLPECESAVGSDYNCPGRAQQERAVCRRDWATVMTPARIEECCTGKLTGAMDCRVEYCPNSEACFTFMSGRCSKPEHVDSPGCRSFCTANPEICADAVRLHCQPGDRLKGEFCRSQCKHVDCTIAYREWANKPENKNEPLAKCFLTAEFAAFVADVKKAFGQATIVLPQCTFAGCAGTESALLYTHGTPLGCPAQCNQQIRADLGDSKADNINIINKCVIGATQTPQTPEEKKAAEDAARRNGNERKNNPPPEDVVDNEIDDEVMEEAEKAAARQRMMKILYIVGIAVAVLTFFLVIFLWMRRRKAAAARAAASA